MPASTTCGGVGMSGSPISRCTTLCPRASSRCAAASTTYAASVPSVSSRAAVCMSDSCLSDKWTPKPSPGVPPQLAIYVRVTLLGALQIHTLTGIHAHLLAFRNELGDLNRDPVRQLRRFGARRLGGAPHDGGGLDHVQLHHRRQLDA